MSFLRPLFVLIISFNFGYSFSQSNNKEKQFGFDVGALVPINYFGAGPLELNESNSLITLSSKIGYQFGMVMKTNYSDRFCIENGIYFYRRNFKLNGRSDHINGATKDSSDFGYVSYGIPIKGMIYIQLDKNVFLSTSIGASLDFYASAVASKGKQNYIYHISDRARWINGAITADLGVEWRNEKNGSFYIGAGVNIPISVIAVTKLKYYYNDQDRNDYDRYNDLFLRGNFFNLKLKYYLPAVKD
jgi:hypothetical protein